MRFWIAVMLVLAGCAGPADAPDQDERPLASPDEPAPRRHGRSAPVPSGEIENVSMDPVSGTVSADGIAHRECGTISGYGALQFTRTAWTFKAGTNATSMRVTAAWDPTNPSIEQLDFEFSAQDEVIAVATASPGAAFSVGTHDVPLDDRSVTVFITYPSCSGDPIVYRNYEGVQARLSVEFVA